MKLQQLRYIWEIAQHDLNVSATADSLYTSQPGISKQVLMLESELGVPIFARNGKHLTEITDAGKQILALAGEILGKAQDIRNIAQDHKDNKAGTLAIATETIDHYENLVLLPCYEWNRCILVPNGHPLAALEKISLHDVAGYPIVTYVFGFTGRSQLDKAFEKHSIHPQVVLTAVDADVIKTYVRLGLGVGIVARMAYDPVADSDLTPIDAEHLFGRSVTKVCLRRDMFIRGFIYDFIRLFAPHLTQDIIHEALALRERHEIEELFKPIPLPVR